MKASEAREQIAELVAEFGESILYPAKRVYTTGEVARLCGVAPRTVVTKWMDGGLLQYYRIPGSQDRRVTHKHLTAFLVENDMTDFVEVDG